MGVKNTMVNYGWFCKGWSKAKMRELATHLRKLLATGKYDDAYKMRPYVECEGDYEQENLNLYEGVRIRRITHLTDEQHDSLITEADKLYKMFENEKKRSWLIN